MPFRVVTLNLEQDHKRWAARQPLIMDEIARLAPDLIAFNEVCMPLQSARDLRLVAAERTGHDYALVQQTKVNSLSKVEGEALLTRFPVIETGNLITKRATWSRWSRAFSSAMCRWTSMSLTCLCRAATTRCGCFRCSSSWP